VYTGYTADWIQSLQANGIQSVPNNSYFQLITFSTSDLMSAADYCKSYYYAIILFNNPTKIIYGHDQKNNYITFPMTDVPQLLHQPHPFRSISD
jgi:hypothetical protein